MADGPAELELRLLDPVVRADRAALERLLHPDFVEFGASGRVWDRAAILAALAAEPGAQPEVSELASAALGDGVVLVTYRAVRADGRGDRGERRVSGRRRARRPWPSSRGRPRG